MKNIIEFYRISIIPENDFKVYDNMTEYLISIQTHIISRARRK